jgi:putative ABC transport system permease protein
MGDLLHELRFAARQLRRRPLYAGIVIFTLALGIGATSAVLSVASPVLFRPLPYPDPDRVVLLSEVDREGGSSTVGYATFADLRRDLRSIAHSAATSSWTPVLTGSGEPEQLFGQSVTADFFKVLGVAPAFGRDFRAEEDVRDRNRVVMLSWGLWQRRFGGDPSIVDRTITLSGTSYAVAGVLPRTFESLLSPTAQVWRPLGYDLGLAWACRTCRHLHAVARMRPEASLEQVQTELNGMVERLTRDFPTEYANSGLRVDRLHDRLKSDVEPALRLMLGAGLFVLLIACANAGNLVLARVTERQGELALRAALGAGHRRVLQLLVAESAVVCLAGAAAGLLLARWGVTGLKALAPPDLPRLDVIALDWRVALAALGATVAVSLVLGVVPGMTALRRSPAAGSSRSVTLGRSHRRVTAGLVVAEVAMAFMLLSAAGLLTRSLGRVLAVDPGFDPSRLLTLQVTASGPRYQENEPVWRMQEQLIEAVRAIPGVEHAAFASQIPLGGNYDTYGVRIEDQPLANPEEAPSADRYAVSDGYLETMRIPLLHGRGLTPADRDSAVPVVLVNQTFARLSWPNEDPIGKRLQMEATTTPWRTIVGVVGDVRHVGLDAERTPQFYVPTSQWGWAENTIVLVVRTRTTAAAQIEPVRRAMRTVEPDLAVSDIASAEERIAVSTSDRRLVMRLFEVFGLVALLLAAAGIYGLLSRRVSERQREIGIRAALGATRRRILRLVLRDGGRLTVLGVAIGLAGALLVSRLLEGLLFGIEPNDPATLGLAVAVLTGVAVGACLLPAWRAARVDPVEALRAE